MSDLVETIPPVREGAKIASEWLKEGTPKEAVQKWFVDSEPLLEQLKKILEAKFQAASQSEYDSASTERARAMDSGYRKAIREIHRLIQLDT